MRYLLLLKRLLKKKSYIAMLLVVPLMVLLLNLMSTADAGLMTIGVYIPGHDLLSRALQQDLENNPGALQFEFYVDKDQLIADVEKQHLTEGWIVPEDFEKTVTDMAEKNTTKNKIEIVIRESGVTHMLGREVLCSRVYPMVAKQIGINYISEKVYDGAPTEEELAYIVETYDGLGINGNLFQMGYLDDNAKADTEEVNYLMMPLRGIFALWLLLCSVAASMYYLEDEKNGLFVWWNTKLSMVRDLLYYWVIILIPTIIVLLGLWFGGVFTTFSREITAIVLYDFLVIAVANILRFLIGSIKGIGILTPIIIMTSAIFSPVFIDIKESRILQGFCPTFHYLYAINDNFYVHSLLKYVIVVSIAWYLLNTFSRNAK